uniref:Uncharacterized protein n=1 Tax=Pipistrellus kuhlii TaxID=59472 RepID=A0A7J7VNC0_PIPKU|nr:hypothetical protein mPipKuh1_008450 [Pipistrellus kuhlii]
MKLRASAASSACPQGGRLRPAVPARPPPSPPALRPRPSPLRSWGRQESPLTTCHAEHRGAPCPRRWHLTSVALPAGPAAEPRAHHLTQCPPCSYKKQARFSKTESRLHVRSCQAVRRHSEAAGGRLPGPGRGGPAEPSVCAGAVGLAWKAPSAVRTAEPSPQEPILRLLPAQTSGSELETRFTEQPGPASTAASAGERRSRRRGREAVRGGGRLSRCFLPVEILCVRQVEARPAGARIQAGSWAPEEKEREPREETAPSPSYSAGGLQTPLGALRLPDRSGARPLQARAPRCTASLPEEPPAGAGRWQSSRLRAASKQLSKSVPQTPADAPRGKYL